MKLGFVSAILPDLPLNEVAEFAFEAGYSCVELMCWPKGKAERRYAGVTHIDVANIKPAGVDKIRGTLEAAGVSISALGYYPNFLTPDKDEAKRVIAHFKKVIQAAALLDVGRVTTFIGRDWTKSVDENWPQFRRVWKPMVKLAEDNDVRICIENCPIGGEEPGRLSRRMVPHVRRHPVRAFWTQLRSVPSSVAAHRLH
jgi:sugar phosphate isomerase/epimerase